MSRQIEIKCNSTPTKNESVDPPNSSIDCVNFDDVSDDENSSVLHKKDSSFDANTFNVSDKVDNDEALSIASSDHVTTNEVNSMKLLYEIKINK